MSYNLGKKRTLVGNDQYEIKGKSQKNLLSPISTDFNGNNKITHPIKKFKRKEFNFYKFKTQ